MNDYIISCCSTTDLNKEHFSERNISYICYRYEMNGKEYIDDFGESIPFPEFYKLMRLGADIKTSQISVGEFEEYFENFLKDGLDVIHVCLSSGLSGTFNSANIARRSLLEKYPDRKLYIVDSLSGSSGCGLLIDKMADFRDSGIDIDQLYSWVENNKLRIHHWFFSSDLSFFVKGGRLSKIAGALGKVLNICPLLNADKFGKLVPRFKPRGKEKAMREMVNQMKIHADNGKDYNDRCYMAHSDCLSDAKCVADMIEQEFTNLKDKIRIFDIGITMGAHSGPGTVALFFWGDPRID